MKQKTYDIAIIGAGIAALAMALAAAKRGKKVAVFERHPQAAGASVRNFGMIWPIGQAAGELFDRAMRSREVWLDLRDKAGLWLRESGSLHLAYHDDEVAVLEEFLATTRGAGYRAKLLKTNEIPPLSKVAKTEGLKAALWSETEINVAPRQAISKIADYLKTTLGVDFYFNTAITTIDFPHISTFDRGFQVEEQIFVCSGADFETLYPSVFADLSVTKCKLQMLATVPQPDGWDMGAMLCAGLTLRHYAAFAHCKTLKAVSDRFDREEPLFKEFGIHVLLSQNNDNQLVIGDSHEYGLHLNPFDREDINRLILTYLNSFTHYPKTFIAERWHGIYPKMTNGETEFVHEVEEGVTLVNALGGAGMTLSFGLAETLMEMIYT
jgi:D-hydroxyproline dehydrogenase subunit beta